jgi:hypothetical protein
MERLEQHFYNMLQSLLSIEATATRIEQTRGMRDAKVDLEESERIRTQCKKIKEEVKRIEILDEEFRKSVDEIFRVH